MSKKHPVIAVTGSSGAGTTTVKRAFEHIFFREKINAAVIEGDSFHSLSRVEFKEAVKKAEAEGNMSFSHFGPQPTTSTSWPSCSKPTANRRRQEALLHPQRRRGRRAQQAPQHQPQPR
jgi:hypothetical protein